MAPQFRPRKDKHGRELEPSMHGFALRNPRYWERMRWLKKWVVENWSKRYVRAEGPATPPVLLDPSDLDGFFTPGQQFPMAAEKDKRTEVNGLALAEAVSSEDVKTGKHHILIDIDRYCVLIPSTQEDHFHLYVQMGLMGAGLDFDDYAEWLRASAKIGLIEPGYAEASIARRATFVRLPWIRKGHEKEDRERALGWWLDQPEEVNLDGKRQQDPAL